MSLMKGSGPHAVPAEARRPASLRATHHHGQHDALLLMVYTLLAESGPERSDNVQEEPRTEHLD